MTSFCDPRCAGAGRAGDDAGRRWSFPGSGSDFGNWFSLKGLWRSMVDALLPIF